MTKKPKILNGSGKHPAPYSKPIADLFADLFPEGSAVLDPMAGDGKALTKALPGRYLFGIELQDWAERESWVQHGNALHLPYGNGSFSYVVTSPTYGNRVNDNFESHNRCRTCKGTGKVDQEPCVKCEGVGRREFNRLTYRHRLGHRLHPDNTGMYGWTGKRGDSYRDLHKKIWSEVERVLTPGGTFVLNVSNHLQTVKGDVVEHPVTEWHVKILEGLGFVEVDTIEVSTDRYRYGENRELRVEHESVVVLRKPVGSLSD